MFAFVFFVYLSESSLLSNVILLHSLLYPSVDEPDVRIYGFLGPQLISEESALNQHEARLLSKMAI